MKVIMLGDTLDWMFITDPEGAKNIYDNILEAKETINGVNYVIIENERDRKE